MRQTVLRYDFAAVEVRSAPMSAGLKGGLSIEAVSDIVVLPVK